MEKKTLPMNLQFFAADPAGNEEDPAATETSTAAAVDTDGGSGQAVADPADSKTDQAVEEKEKAGDGQTGDPTDDMRKLVQEEMKKASMTPEERAKYEADEREKSLKAREEAISMRERTADAKELLAENGLPASFVEMVVGEDKAATEKNVKAFKAQFDTAVQAQVEKRLGGKTPETGSGVSGTGRGDAMMEEILSCF